MNTGEEYPITQSYVLELAELYPAVDIMQELRAMKGWCDANPRKRQNSRRNGNDLSMLGFQRSRTEVEHLVIRNLTIRQPAAQR